MDGKESSSTPINKKSIEGIRQKKKGVALRYSKWEENIERKRTRPVGTCSC